MNSSLEVLYINRLNNDRKKLSILYSESAKYDCPCNRHNMSKLQFKKYKQKHMNKVWNLLHELSFCYLYNPSEILQKKMYEFLTIDVNNIRCYTCQKHYKEYLKNNNVKYACKSRTLLIKWLIDMHNNVNLINNKKEMTYKEVFELYNKVYNIY